MLLSEELLLGGDTGEARSGGACVAFDSSEQSERSYLDAASMTIPFGGGARGYSTTFGPPRISHRDGEGYARTSYVGVCVRVFPVNV